VQLELAQDDERWLGKATADLNQAIRLRPDEAELYTLRGTAHWMRRNEVAAIADFSRAIGLAPDGPEAHFCRARSHASLGEVILSEVDLRRAAALGSEEALAQLALDASDRWQ
jgi:Flp pilus assembly protein TadD